MKDSLCELKRSPVPECLPRWAPPESEPCCLDSSCGFLCIQHISLAKICLVAFLFSFFFLKSSCVMDCGQHRWCHFSKGKQKQISYELLMYCCLFKAGKIHLKVSRMSVPRSLRRSLSQHFSHLWVCFHCLYYLRRTSKKIIFFCTAFF